MEKEKIKNPNFVLIELPQNLSFHIIKFLTDKKLDYKTFSNFDEALSTIEIEANIIISLSHRLIKFLENYKNTESISLNYFFIIYQYFDDLDTLTINYPNLTFDFINALVSPEIINYKIEKFLQLITKSSKLINYTLLKLNEDLKKDTDDVDLLIQELEFKLLQTEIKEEKLSQELELKRLYEKELSKLNNHLQEQAIRINDLNNELKSFTYSVTHDIKAPLRGIIGYSQELIKRHSESLNERGKYCVKQIDSSARNLENLIQDLLSYTRIELELPIPIDVNVNELIEQIINSRINEINKYNTKINLNIECNEIKCWERGLNQILSNLIDNAIKYSSKSQNPEVTITSKKNNDIYLIKVEDNGIGFDMKYHDKIFELFHRMADQSVYEGTGAGLAICKRLVNKMRGKIWAESEINKGSKFFIELPEN
ncbi:MAG: ATP-binding protein [Melioribacteraceae bacterium]|nr:ATP-binding protein [Melioribacteraceae bacterium]